MQGSELKAARKSLGMTQAEFAAELGLTGTFIGLMERGEKPIEPRTGMAVRYLVSQDYIRRTRDQLQGRIEQLLDLDVEQSCELSGLNGQLEQLNALDHVQALIGLGV